MVHLKLLFLHLLLLYSDLIFFTKLDFFNQNMMDKITLVSAIFYLLSLSKKLPL